MYAGVVFVDALERDESPVFLDRKLCFLHPPKQFIASWFPRIRHYAFEEITERTNVLAASEKRDQAFGDHRMDRITVVVHFGFADTNLSVCGAGDEGPDVEKITKLRIGVLGERLAGQKLDDLVESRMRVGDRAKSVVHHHGQRLVRSRIGRTCDSLGSHAETPSSLGFVIFSRAHQSMNRNMSGPCARASHPSKT